MLSYKEYERLMKDLKADQRAITEGLVKNSGKINEKLKTINERLRIISLFQPKDVY